MLPRSMALRSAAAIARRALCAPRLGVRAIATEEGKAFHALGFNIGKQVQQQVRGFSPEDVDDILGGIRAALLDQPPQVPLKEYLDKVSALMQAREAAKAEVAKAAGAEFLKAAAAEAGAVQTASGLVIKMLEEGSGASPTARDTVEVNYEGKLIDGTVFDSSYQRGESISFPLSDVIKGWTEGLQLMKPGGKATLTIPPEIAYGPRGSPPVIPPEATLVFTIELIAVK